MGKRPPSSPAPHRSRPNSTYTFPVGEDCLIELVRLAERLRAALGDPWPFQAAVADMILDDDVVRERSDRDRYARWGWSRQQYRDREADLLETMKNWLSAYGRLSPNPAENERNHGGTTEEPRRNPKSDDSAVKSHKENHGGTTREPRRNHPPYNNITTPTPTGGSGAPAREAVGESGGDHAAPVSPPAGVEDLPVAAVVLPDGTRRPDADSVVRVALQQQGWTPEQEPVLRLWVETHESKFPSQFDAREIRQLCATHGVERVADGIRWMGGEGYLKLSRLRAWLQQPAADGDLPERPETPASYGLLSYREMTARPRGFMQRCEMYRLAADPSGSVWGREIVPGATPIPETFAVQVAP
ncbi:MAG: hypothetical protein ABIQ57_00945 [Candidatus Kapaibacterium sp.]